MEPISLSCLARVKKAAKAAKIANPSLKHAHLLDVHARNLCGVRDYHELKRRYEAAIDGVPEVDVGPVLHCPHCDFTFDSSFRDDVLKHRQPHQAYDEVAVALTFTPANYKTRESIKQRAWDWVRSGVAERERFGALGILCAHYDRSLAAAIDNGLWAQHPYFDEYLRCALPGSDLFGVDIRDRLITEFGAHPGFIEPGKSYWTFRDRRDARVLKGNKQDAAALRSNVLSVLQSG